MLHCPVPPPAPPLPRPCPTPLEDQSAEIVKQQLEQQFATVQLQPLVTKYGSTAVRTDAHLGRSCRSAVAHCVLPSPSLPSPSPPLSPSPTHYLPTFNLSPSLLLQQKFIADESILLTRERLCIGLTLFEVVMRKTKGFLKEVLFTGPIPTNGVMSIDECQEFHRIWSAVQFVYCIPLRPGQLTVE